MAENECLKESLFKLADRIDREYIPRPRYEDGEVVSENDPYGNAVIECVCVYFDGNWLVNLSDGSQLEGTLNQHVPNPKILNADGDTVKKGDTVWGLDGHKGTVKSVNRKDSTAYVEWDNGRFSLSVLCDKLTHKEPDSLEKLRDDMAGKGPCYMYAQEWADRLDNLIDDACEFRGYKKAN